MKLEDIGFYTLSDARAKRSSSKSRLERCEIIITDACNFKCPYCRGIKSDFAGTMSRDAVLKVLDYWISEKLVNVRFSGGEPTIHKNLPEFVRHCKAAGVQHIAVSSNGSAPREKYQELLDCGVNDFSISLDACCASTGDTMAGVKGKWQQVVENIEFISRHTYITVGVVLTEDNVAEANSIVKFADSLGVSDIRIIPAAQWKATMQLDINQGVLNRHPILRYKVGHLNSGGKVRGLNEHDSNRCGLVLDDMAVVQDYHFPCIIYLREQGEPIGKIGSTCRRDRERWAKEHNKLKMAVYSTVVMPFLRSKKDGILLFQSTILLYFIQKLALDISKM